MIDRRSFVTAGSASAALAALGFSGATLAQQQEQAAAVGLQFASPRPFSFDGLIAQAEALAKTPFVNGNTLPAALLEQIDYDAHGKIKFDPGYALFKDGPGQFPVTFFHLGRYFQTPVHMHTLETTAGGDAFEREIVYDEAYFDMPADSPAHQLPPGAGFAGFRFHESRLGDQQALPWQKNDWVAFLGASYFRAIGELYQYGLSARGVLVDTAVAGQPEDFPVFTHFYFEPPVDGSDTVVVYALLDGASLTGAYRFSMRRDKAVEMEIDCRVFLRRDVTRLGIAPLTSMYWYSETAKPGGVDWRPEIHDSDGLALWTGAGERIWRPLNNPRATTASAFADRKPHGFGLLQRDRAFDHYLDGVHYDRRPSLWVEPLGDWGEGAVQLIEIPTEDEVHDNTVAAWVPAAPAVAGASFRYGYRLYWTDRQPFPPNLALVQATRMGPGGQPGQPRPAGAVKFVVEFLGGELPNLPFGVKPEAVLSAASGSFSHVFTEAVPDGIAGHWRAQFDFIPTGPGAVDLRLYLRSNGQPLSETWIYQLQTV